jgi:hypothetical protein
MRSLCALLVLVFAPAAWADVSHYRGMAERLAIEGDAYFRRQQPTRALESFARLFHYDGDYAPAAVGMLRTAQILLAQMGPGETERHYAASLLLRYVLGTPDVERAARTSPIGIDPVREATELLLNLGKWPAPLSNSMGHRKGPEAALPGAKKLITEAMEAAHKRMPVGAAGQWERELGVLRAEWQDPAKAALASLLAARATLSPEQRLSLILAACADSRDEGRGYEDPPCAILQKQWPGVAAGLTEQLRPLVTDLDPGWRAIALLLLGKQGGVPSSESPAQRGQFLNDIEHDRKRAEAVLESFVGQPLQAHQAAFEEVVQGWLDGGRGATNPYPVEQRLSLAYRAVYRMNGGAEYLVTKVARDQEPLRRASAAWALACSGQPADLTRSKLVQDGDAVVQAGLAIGVGECADVKMAGALDRLFQRGNAHVAIEAARALRRVADKGPFRSASEPLLTLAKTAFSRSDLGTDTKYVFQDVLEAMLTCNDPKVVALAARFHTTDAYLAERQLDFLYTKAPLDPAAAIAFAKPYLGDANRTLMRLAEKVTDRAQDEMRTRGRP